MSVCNDIVCEAIVCDYDPCSRQIPSMCGNTMPITMTSCSTDKIVPQVECIGTSVEAPMCD